MPTWLQIVLGCGGSALITWVITNLCNLAVRKKKMMAEQKQLREDIVEALKKEMMDVKDKIAVLETSYTSHTEEYKDNFKDVKYGLQAVLRHDLLESYNYWSKRGYCPQENKRDFDNMYERYEKLGENGVMTENHRKLMSLPDEK